MNIYIVQGGIGKHVMFSSLIEKLSEKDGEKIMIVSAYPDLFKYHPKVEVSANFPEAGFYDKYVKGTDNNIIYREPYLSNYAKGETHFIKELAELLEVEYDNDVPDIYVDKYALEESERFVENFPKFIAVQFSGGQSPLGFDKTKPFFNNGQLKDYPRDRAQDVVNMIAKDYPDYKILNYALPNEQTANLENAISIESPYLFYVALLTRCKAYIGIDSSLQHFAANRYNQNKGIVLWGSTGPQSLGYEKNFNLAITKEHTNRPLCSTIGDVFTADGNHWQHPDPECMNFDPAFVIDKLDECIKHNEELPNQVVLNVVENDNMLDINEKTQQMLLAIENEVGRLNEKYQNVVDAYVAANNKEGSYRVSSDRKRLIKA